jgi:hypothetical protein
MMHLLALPLIVTGASWLRGVWLWARSTVISTITKVIHHKIDGTRQGSRIHQKDSLVSK